MEGLMVSPVFPGSFSSFPREGQMERPPLQRMGWAGMSQSRLFCTGTSSHSAWLVLRLLQSSCSEGTRKVEGGFPISKEVGMYVGFITGIWQRREPHFLPGDGTGVGSFWSRSGGPGLEPWMGVSARTSSHPPWPSSWGPASLTCSPSFP